MIGVREIIEDLKFYIDGTERDNLDIDINRTSDRVLGDLEMAYSPNHILGNLSDKFERLGDGTTRHTYRIQTDDYGSRYQGKVIKFCKGPTLRKKNKKEIETWMTVRSHSIGSYFAPIRLFDKRNSSWLIMDYAEPTVSREDADLMKDKITDKIQKNNDGRDYHFDIHFNNVGRHPKRGKVLIDYPWGGDFKIA